MDTATIIIGQRYLLVIILKEILKHYGSVDKDIVFASNKGRYKLGGITLCIIEATPQTYYLPVKYILRYYFNDRIKHFK